MTDTTLNKLMGITASELMLRLLSVDGPGSGLDADYLDGYHGSFYRDASNINAGTLAVAYGGTGLSTIASGSLLYASSANTIGALTPSGQGLLVSNGSSVPSWGLALPIGVRYQAATASAAGTTNATATQLSYDCHIIDTATADQGVKLPTHSSGRLVMVQNVTNVRIKVYPASTASIDGKANGAAVDLPPRSMMVFQASASASQWYSATSAFVDSPSFTGKLTNNSGLSLGGTAGNAQDLAEVNGTASENVVKLVTRTHRRATGTDYTTAAIELRHRVDTTDYGFIRFYGTDKVTIGDGTTERFTFGSANAVIGTPMTVIGNTSINGTLSTYTGTLNTQVSLRNLGWQDGNARWREMIETDASFSTYGLDAAAATPVRISQMGTTSAGGSNYVKFFGDVIAQASTAAVNTNVFLKDEAGLNQGLLFWDRASDTVRLRRYNAVGTGAEGELALTSTDLTWNGNIVYHAGNAAAAFMSATADQTVSGSKTFSGSVTITGAASGLSAANPTWQWRTETGARRWRLQYGATDATDGSFNFDKWNGSAWETKLTINAAADTLSINGNAVWHAGNFNPAGYVSTTGAENIGGVKTFTSVPRVNVASGLSEIALDLAGANVGGMFADATRTVMYAASPGYVSLRPNGRGSAVGELKADTTGFSWNGQAGWHAGNFDPAGKMDTTWSLTAGNGLTGGGSGAANRTLTLGTPGSLSAETTNAVTATSHTHDIALAYLYNDDDRTGVIRTTPDTYRDRGLSVAFNSGANLGIGATYGMSLHIAPWTVYNAAYKQQQLVFRGDATEFYWRAATSDTTWGPYYKVHTDATTDINAATLAGALPSVASSSSTIVQRHASGYVYANYFNSTSGFTASAPSAVWVETSSDGFLRKQTIADLMTNGGAWTSSNFTPTNVPTQTATLNFASGNGTGVQFWASNQYAIYMSSAVDATYGGRIAGETTSDYNMYFKMTGGTNRGFVWRNNTTVVGGLDGVGNMRIAGSFTGDDYVIGSDRRFKTDIRDFEYRGRLNPQSFTLLKSGKADFGFIAQHVKRLYPEAVYRGEDGMLRLSMPKLVTVVSYQANQLEDNLVKTDKQVAKLVKENGKLKTEVKSLKTRLARLEKQVAKLAA